MHVDLDYFYAQCEEKNDSTLRVRPVVVCVYSGRTEESGVVSTANYLARKYGVRAGVPIVREETPGINERCFSSNEPPPLRTSFR